MHIWLGEATRFKDIKFSCEPQRPECNSRSGNVGQETDLCSRYRIIAIKPDELTHSPQIPQCGMRTSHIFPAEEMAILPGQRKHPFATISQHRKLGFRFRKGFEKEGCRHTRKAKRGLQGNKVEGFAARTIRSHPRMLRPG